MAPNASAFRDWYAGLPIPWLVSGPNGQAEANAWPALLDAYVQQLVSARYCAFPDKAPVDALGHLGGDRQFIQGSAESNSSFTARLKDAWGQWSRAGTWCSVLEQLYYFGLTNAVIVQPNGLSYTLSGAPTPGQDPTSLVVASATSTLGCPLTSSTMPTRPVPAGNAWFSLSSDANLTNQFAVIAPTWPFSAIALAKFIGTNSATVTWTIPFSSTAYSLMIGTPTDAVSLYADGTTQTKTGITIRSSAPWTGSVWVIAFASGINPLNWFDSTSYGAMQRLISAFRPNATCVGVYFIATGGRTWDCFPAGTTWDGGTYATWDTNTVTQVLSAF